MRSIHFDKLAHDAARPDPRVRRDAPTARPVTVPPVTTTAPPPTPPATTPPAPRPDK